jgi:hypothetical protein
VAVKLTALPLELFEPRRVERLVDPVTLAKGKTPPRTTDSGKLEKMARSKAVAVGLFFGVEVGRALIAHIDRVVALTDSLPLLAEHDMRVLFEKGFAAFESDVIQTADELLEEMRAAGMTPTGAASAVKHAQDLLTTPGNRFRGLDVLERLNPNYPNGVLKQYLRDLQFANAARSDSAHAAQRAAEAKKVQATPGKEVGSARGSGLSGEEAGAPAHTTAGERRLAAAVLGGVCILHNSNDGCPGKRGCRHTHVLLGDEIMRSLTAAVRLVFVPHGGVRTGPFIPARDRSGALHELRREAVGAGPSRVSPHAAVAPVAPTVPAVVTVFHRGSSSPGSRGGLARGGGGAAVGVDAKAATEKPTRAAAPQETHQGRGALDRYWQAAPRTNRRVVMSCS